MEFPKGFGRIFGMCREGENTLIPDAVCVSGAYYTCVFGAFYACVFDAFYE